MILTNVAPLHTSFMLTSVIGMILSGMWLYPRDASWGIGIGLIFAIMFISSLISMTYGPTEIELREYQKRLDEIIKKRK
ncbi:MAG: hypothetical protein NTV63_03595 [Candidatus Woesearchaeota archaeon]|nr:hypothetical protein [Candidatus Woesearchaeota archaeon]